MKYVGTYLQKFKAEQNYEISRILNDIYKLKYNYK